MTKIYQIKALLLFIVTAFLALQWSTAHIHLAEHHHHDGSHHQHASQGHLHDYGSQHFDVIDASHADSHQSIVELDHECTSPGWNKSKLDDHADVLVQTDNHFEYQTHYEIVHLTVSNESGASWLSYSTVRLRAPPQFAS